MTVSEEIQSALQRGESVIYLMVKYGWNAVVKATHTPKKRRSQRRRERYEDDDADLRV